MTGPTPPTRTTALALHSLLLALGTAVATYLTATFATGLPTTQAGWRALLLGTVAAALSRLFGWLVNRLNVPPGGPQ